jgi:signal transduction histidine kinase
MVVSPFRALRARILASYASAAVVLLVGAASFGAVQSLVRTTVRVDRTRQEIDTANVLLRALTEAETGQRGYVITGWDRYLTPYRASLPVVDSSLEALRRFAASNAALRPLVDSLAFLSRLKLDELNAGIVLRSQGGFDTAAKFIRTNLGERTMFDTRRIAATFVAAERIDLGRREARARWAADGALVVIAAGSVIAFLLAARATSQLQAQHTTVEGQQVELATRAEETDTANRQLVVANVRAEGAIRSQHATLARLSRTNIELDQFAYVASHDLKAPLRGIANLAAWVEEDLGSAVTPTAREHLSLLRGRVHRMEALIDGILHYSRAGRVQSTPESVDVGALVHESIELLAPAPQVAIDVAPNMPTLVTDRVPLQQVFLNLIGNAIKHSRRGDPQVTVGVSRTDGGEPDFSVTDNGPGIAPEYHERIFGIFQTLEARDKVEGTGIGLSVVKKIVEARGGRVAVESAPGRGATFRFTWPEPTEEN